MKKVNVVYDNPKDRPVKCRRLSEETDWCLAEAGKESLREHMKLLKEAYAEIERLTNLQRNEIVVGDRMVDENGDAEGTLLTSTHWDKRMIDAELTGKWCQIIIRPVNV
jgi:hypothetical protein